MSTPTTTVTFEVPAEALAALRRSPAEFGREMRVAAAVHWYARHEASMEQAALIAGLNRRDFLLELAGRGVDTFGVDFDDLERELARD